MRWRRIFPPPTILTLHRSVLWKGSTMELNVNAIRKLAGLNTTSDKIARLCRANVYTRTNRRHAIGEIVQLEYKM